MSPEDAKKILEARPRGRPDADSSNLIKQAKIVLKNNPTDTKRGRPIGIKDSAPRAPKSQTEKIISPLVEAYTKLGNAKFVKHLGQIDTNELKKESKLSFKSAKELIATKVKGRPSVDVYVKRMAAHELVKRCDKNSTLVRKHPKLRDRFRAKRRGGGRARKKLKTLPPNQNQIQP